MKNSSNDILDFTLIYNKYKQFLYNYVLKLVNDKVICDDLVQQTFLKLFENIELIKNKAGIKSWLFTTARNEVFTQFRKKKVRKDHFIERDTKEINISGEKLSDSYEKKELKELVMIELDDLPEEQKEVFLLKEYGGLSYKEISAALNIEEKLVKSRLYKTRQKLITRLQKVLEREQ